MAEFITAIRTTEGDKKYDYNALGNLPDGSVNANAIKGTASGEVVALDDISPIAHVVRCTVRSKNLLNMSSLLNPALVANGDGTYTITKNGNNRFSEEIPLDKSILPGSSIAVSVASVLGTVENIAIQLLSADRNNTHELYLNQAVLSRTLELEFEAARVRVFLQSSETDGDYATFKNLQLEIGNAVTEYTPYVDPATITVMEETTGATYIPDADGICEVPSVFPAMTLLTDTPNTTIECEYCRDANKVIAEIFAAMKFGGVSYTSSISLPAAGWQGTESPYSQVVSINGTTEYSKVDINPSVEQLAIFHQKDIAFVTENEDGVITVYCIGQKPTNDYTMQVTITEVIANA